MREEQSDYSLEFASDEEIRRMVNPTPAKLPAFRIYVLKYYDRHQDPIYSWEVRAQEGDISITIARSSAHGFWTEDEPCLASARKWLKEHGLEERE